MTYSGISYKTFNDEELCNFYNNIDMGFYINEYIVVKNHQDEVIDKRRWNGESYIPLKYKSIKNDFFNTVSPLNTEQELFFDLLQNDDIIGKMVQGKFGSGKTMLTATFALDRILNRRSKQDKIVYLRNNVEVAGVPQLGSLPSDMYSKLTPYVMPLADILGSKEMLDNYVAMGRIQVEHLGFIRGRSFKNSILILSEAENVTADIMALVISRVGENSILIVDGDCRQIDKEIFRKSSGMLSMAENLKGEPMFGMVTLKKSERSPFACLADKLME